MAELGEHVPARRACRLLERRLPGPIEKVWAHLDGSRTRCLPVGTAPAARSSRARAAACC